MQWLIARLLRCTFYTKVLRQLWASAAGPERHHERDHVPDDQPVREGAPQQRPDEDQGPSVHR